MYTFKLDINPSELDKMCLAHPLLSIYQLAAWSKIKKDWGSFNIAIYHDEVLVGGAYVLKRHVVGPYNMGYITRGPLIDFQNEEEVKCMAEAMKALAKREKMISIKFDPNLYQSFDSANKEEAINARFDETVALLGKYQCKHAGYTLDLYDNVQPRMQVSLPNCNLEERFNKKLREKLKTADKLHVEIEKHGIEAADDFAGLVALTEKRKGIILRDADYFKLMLNSYPEHSCIYLAYVNLKEAELELQMNISTLERELNSLDKLATKKIEETKKKIAKIEKELSDVSARKANHGDRVLVSGLLL